MKIVYGKEFGFHRAKVDRLHGYVNQVPQVDCPVRHFFADGVCGREITIPAGITLIGAVHKVESLAVLSKGRIVLATPAGPIEISAPHTLTVMPGDKNTATALEEAVWTNFWPNPGNEKSIDLLIERVSESKASDLIGGATNKQLAANRAAELEA